MKEFFSEAAASARGERLDLVWERENPFGALICRFIAFVVGVVRRAFGEDLCTLRATALAYTTILSLVPLLALIFAVMKGLGVQNRLEPLIMERVAVGSQETVTYIVDFINNMDVRGLGAVGLVGVIFTVLSVLGTIERSLNDIWRVKKARTFFRRFSDYLSVVIVGPIFLVAAISLTATLQNHALFQRLMEYGHLRRAVYALMRLTPFVCMWVAFTFLYIFMPNTRVKFRSALLGGIIAGTVWQLAQWGYVHFQVGFAKYNSIYGALAALPIFMVWIYFSWLIVLLGAEVASAHQEGPADREGSRSPGPAFRELTALRVLEMAARRFRDGSPPLTAADLSGSPGEVVEIVAKLCASGFLARVDKEGEEAVYLPSRDPAKVRLGEVAEAMSCPAGALPQRDMTIGDLLAGGEWAASGAKKKPPDRTAGGGSQ